MKTMHQNLWKPAPIKARRGQAAFWPKFFRYPVVALGVLMMLLTLRLGVSHALAGHGRQKIGPTPAFAVYSAALYPKWDTPFKTLTSDDDDDDDGGDDDPTS
jgi:hypothetical protein